MIVIDGTESMEGRALLAIAALYWCTDWLSSVDLRLCDVVEEDVVLAAQNFEWDCGAPLTLHRPSSVKSPIAEADLYAAIAFRNVDHLRLGEAEMVGVPALVAVQFPVQNCCRSSFLLRQSSAFDPRSFARDLHNVVKPWL